MLREHEPSVRDDVEDAVVTPDQSGFDSQLSSELRPQTGGARKVVSTYAVRDRDVHRVDSCRRPVTLPPPAMLPLRP